VAAADRNTGINDSAVLVLVGPQGIGKSTWCKHLVGELTDLFLGGIRLDPSNKDDLMMCTQNWIVELGELDATFRKADIANLKAFLTRSEDRYRAPYAAKVETYPRRTVFCASVNDPSFLVDKTGNRRFFTIECGSNLNAYHDINVQQLWAEVYSLYLKDEPHYLNREEMALLSTHNEMFASTDVYREVLESKFDWSIPPSEWESQDRMNGTELARLCGYEKPTQQIVRELVASAISLGSTWKKVNGIKRLALPKQIYFAVGSGRTLDPEMDF
jgi:putative DNA primase/helicase